MPVLLGVMLIVPLVATAIALALPARVGQGASVVAGAAALGMAVALALGVRHGAVPTALSGWLRLDSLGAVFLLAVGFLYATAALFSVGYLRAGRRDFGGFSRRYFTYLNLFAWTMLLVPEASDFGVLWIAIELTTVVSALMVALERTDAALEASWKYILIASAGLALGLLAVIVLYAAGTGALGDAYLPRFGTYLHAAHRLPVNAVEFAFLLAAIGFGTKAGFVPVHTWLPDAHSEAPSPVSALLSGALLVDALYAILRFHQVSVATAGPAFSRHVLIVLGALSLVAAALFVLRQRSYKRLLAYSSIEHIGVIALGIGFGAPLAVAGALLHVLNHAAAKGLAFFGAGSILRRYDTKEIDGVRGAGRILPLSGPMFLVAAVALSGLPLSGIFRSEFQIVAGGFRQPEYVGVALLIVFVNVAFFGVVWHLGRMVLSPPSAQGPPRGETSRLMVLAMVVCLIVVVGIGIHLPGALGQLLGSAAHSLEAPGS